VAPDDAVAKADRSDITRALYLPPVRHRKRAESQGGSIRYARGITPTPRFARALGVDIIVREGWLCRPRP